MKTILSLNSFLLLCNCLFGQYFVNPAAKWNLTRSHWGGASHITWEYQFRDSIRLNSQLYWTLYNRQQREQPQWKSDGSYYREENGRVYLYRKWSSKEDLAYDFNIDSVGQQITIGGNLSMKVIGIDSIQLNDGNKKRRIKFATFRFWWPDTTYWIEGIGGTDDTMIPFELNSEVVDGEDIKLDCFYLNDSLLFKTSPFSTCYVYSVQTADFEKKRKFKITPNPTTNHFVIENPDSENSISQLLLFGFSGKLLFEVTNPERFSSSNFSFSDIPAGVYFLGVVLRTGETYFEKIEKL